MNRCRAWTSWAAALVSTVAAPLMGQTTRRANRPPEPPPPTLPAETRDAFLNARYWPDAAGAHVNAHGGNVVFADGTYYWYGENRAVRTPEMRWPPSPGVSVYTSRDLYNWTDAGIALHTLDDPASDLTRGCNIERPKVVHNARTGQYVMWFHLELKGQGYAAARAGLAVADAPQGPFRFVRSLRPNAGRWPIDLPAPDRAPLTVDEQKALMAGDRFRKGLVAGAYARRDFAGGQMSRDMTVFVDPDTARAYLITSAEENYTLHVHELTDDYLDFTGKWARVAPGGHNEAPAVIKHEGKYHLLASGCTGWDPNAARSLVADDIWGPWTAQGNPARGVNPANGLGPERTWGGQSTFILPLPGKPGRYLAMFDVWRPGQLRGSGYLWLPLVVRDGKMVITYRDRWTLDDPVDDPVD